MLLTLRVALVATFLAMVPGLLDGFETPKAVVVRIAGIGLIAAALSRPGALRRLRLQPLDLAVASWLLVEIVTTVLSRAPWLSVFGELQQHEGLLTSISLAGIYLAARLALRDAGDVQAVLDTVLLGAGVASVYAFLQAAGLDPVSWSRAASFGGAARPFATFGHPNLLGIAGSTAFAIALGRTLEPRSPRWPYAVAALAFAAGTVITLSRGAWLGMGAGAGVALMLAWRARGGALRTPMWIGLGLAAALVLFAIFGGANPIALRLREIVSPGAGTGRTRIEIWRTALAAWRARPWIGNGPDTLAMLFTLYQTPEYWRYEWLGLAGHAHDIYLHVLATRGVLGLAAGAACAATLAMAARAAWKAGAVSRGRVAAILAGIAALAVAGGFGALGIAGALCLTLLAAMVATLASPAPRPAAAPQPRKKRAAPAPAPDPGARRAAVVGALGALAIAIPMAREMEMSYQVNHAYGWVSLGRPASDPQAQALNAEMIERCRRVLHHAPWDDNAPAVLAEAALRSSFGAPDPRDLLAEAEASARDAVRRVPLRSANHRRLALVLSQESQLVDRGRLPEAEAEFARALDLAPQDAILMVEWTRSRLATGRVREALIPAERAARLYPESGLALGALGEARLAVGDTLGARAALERAAASDQGTNPAAQQRAADLLGSVTGGR